MENRAEISKFLKPVRLTYRNPIFTQSEMEAANKINVWHKCILFNVSKEDKNWILDSLIETCAPVFLVPVMYTMESANKATFLFFCRSNTIQKLVNQKLQLKMKNGKIINYDIVLSFLAFNDFQLNPQKIITDIVKLRFSREPLSKKCLNLQNFTSDHRLGSLYVPIHIPVVFNNILRLSRGLITNSNGQNVKFPVRNLILKSNNMTSLHFSEKVFNFHLTKLDVRDNKLYDVSLLRPFSEFQITEVWLTGNPLCDKYKKPKDYINAIQYIFPHLQLLDGQVVGADQKIPIFHKHYISDKSKISLMKQFVEHFFACYDQDDRTALNGLYDSQALFSMTIGPIVDSSHKQIIKSFSYARNLLKFVDYAKCTECLLNGPEKIIAALKLQPATLHKLKFLEMDVLYATNNSFAICIQGPFLFRKNNVSPLWFQRTLIVVAKKDNEFCIINDQYHIDNCPASLNNLDLSEFKLVNDKSVPELNPIVFSPSEKFEILRYMQDLTTMNVEYSEKLLKKTNWDIHHGIKTFLYNYKSNFIPEEAFR